MPQRARERTSLEQPSESLADDYRDPPVDAPHSVYGAARGHCTAGEGARYVV